MRFRPQKTSRTIGFKAFTKIKLLWLENGVWGHPRSAATGASIFAKWLWFENGDEIRSQKSCAGALAVPRAFNAP